MDDMDGGSGNNGGAQPQRDAKGKFLPGCVKVPGSGLAKGTRHPTPWDRFQGGLLDFVQIPLEILKTPEDRELFLETLRLQALENPGGYMSKVIAPLIRLMPQSFLVDVIASIDTDPGDRADEIRQVRELLQIAVAKKVDLDVVETALQDGESET